MLRVRIGQHSQAGTGKALNQDFHGAAVPGGSLLQTKGIAVALADGIGSSAQSHVASAAAVRGFLEDYFNTSESWPVRRAARCVLQATNAWLHAQTQLGEGRFDKDRGCVCTFSALVFKGRDAHLLHVGDSRIYRLHAQALEQLTHDHRVRGPGAESWLGRALGVDRSVEIDYQSWGLEIGEAYLLATDGAYEHLDATAVHAALGAFGEDLDAAAAALVAGARARGSQDDATVQLVRIEALPAPEANLLHRQREGLALPPPLQPRMAFEGYTIVRELHASARSHVHLALDNVSGQPVVIKTPSLEAATQPEALDRLLLEEWVARRVDSPHLLKAAPGERPRQHLFVAMEYRPGQTLAQWMTDHPAPTLDEVRRIVGQAALGLQALHRKAMVHGDVRPANVMIDDGGTVCLIDFGATLVAGLAEGTSAAAGSVHAGELQYAAPESLLGRETGPLSDLFSLAVLTYQMLCGRLPFGLDLSRVRSERDLHRLRYQPLRQHRPELPSWLDAVLRKALNTNPRQRQQAMSELVHDLREPGPEFRRDGKLPLIERSPAAFWRGLAIALAVALVVALAKLVLGASGSNPG
ncbi:MAG: protein kinase [Burkholderiales bacterium]